MAVVFATKTGNWSDTTVWNTGSLPTSADDAYSNNFTVTINQNINVKSISNEATTGVTAGGGFTVSATPLTIQGNLVQGTGTLLTVTQGASGRFDITGNVTAARGIAISLLTYNVLNITGNVTAGTATTSSCHGINVNTSQGFITINGNLNGGTGTGTSCTGINMAASVINTTITVNGLITGGATSSSNGIGLGTSNVGTTINANGGVTSGTGSGVVINQNATNFTMNVTGDVTCPATVSAAAITTTSTGWSGVINITGTITGGGGDAVYIGASPGAAMLPIYHTGTCIAGRSGSAITAYGYYAYTTGPALCNEETGANVIYSGNMPFNGRVMFYPSAFGSFYWRTYSSLTQGSPAFREAKNLYFTDAYAASYPAVSNVRSGTTYGVGSIYTGTCAVPPAGSVLFGVPVGNTTGTAALDAASIRSAIGLSAANLDTQLSGLSSGQTTINNNVSARLLASAYTTPPNTDAIAAAVWSYTGGRLLSSVSAIVSGVWTAASRQVTGGSVDSVTTLVNAPDVPSAAEISDAVKVGVREELGPELARVANSATTQEVAEIVEGALSS